MSDPDRDGARDAWLSQALRHAPDSNAAPPTALSEAILVEAVRRMLPKNKLATKMLNKLKVYVGAEHPHQAQNPQPKELAVK